MDMDEPMDVRAGLIHGSHGWHMRGPWMAHERPMDDALMK